MAYPNHSLVGAIRDVLKEHGITSARVEVELHPRLQASNELLVVVYSPDPPQDSPAAPTLPKSPAELPMLQPPPRSPPKATAAPVPVPVPAGLLPPEPEALDSTARPHPVPEEVPRQVSANSPPPGDGQRVEEPQRPESQGRVTPTGKKPTLKTRNSDAVDGDSFGEARSSGFVRPSSGSSSVFTHTQPNQPQAYGTGATRQIGSGRRSRSSTSLPSIERAGSHDGSKQRLLDMLEEQREMEEQRAESRVRHESLVREAEAYIEERNRERAKNNEGQTRSPRTPLSTRTRSSQGASSPSSIQVVKFTMPAGGRAKDEVVTQLSFSNRGSEHVSNKDKFSALYREQDKLLRDAEAGEEEYQKLLQQAIAYNEQRAQRIARERAAQEEGQS